MIVYAKGLNKGIDVSDNSQSISVTGTQYYALKTEDMEQGKLLTKILK